MQTVQLLISLNSYFIFSFLLSSFAYLSVALSLCFFFLALSPSASLSLLLLLFLSLSALSLPSWENFYKRSYRIKANILMQTTQFHHIKAIDSKWLKKRRKTNFRNYILRYTNCMHAFCLAPKRKLFAYLSKGEYTHLPHGTTCTHTHTFTTHPSTLFNII